MLHGAGRDARAALARHGGRVGLRHSRAACAPPSSIRRAAPRLTTSSQATSGTSRAVMDMLSTLGDQPCHFILVFDNGYFSEFGTFSISDWIGHAPKELLAKNFGLPASTFDRFPNKKSISLKGKVPPPLAAPPMQGWKLPPLTHKYSLLSQKPYSNLQRRPGVAGWTRSQFPISTTMTGVVLDMDAGGCASCTGIRTPPSGNTSSAANSTSRCSARRALARGAAEPGRRRLHSARLRSLDRERRHRESAHPHRL